MVVAVNRQGRRLHGMSMAVGWRDPEGSLLGVEAYDDFKRGREVPEWRPYGSVCE